MLGMTFWTYVECLRCGRFVRAGTEGFCANRHLSPAELVGALAP